MLERMPADPSGSSRKIEITTILVIGAAVLALVSLHSSAAGAVGTWIADVLRYLFGQLASVPPILSAVITILAIRRVERPGLVRKLWAVAILFFAVMFAWHLMAGQRLPFSWTELREWDPQQPGAGVLGGWASYLLESAFGVAGAYVVVVVIALISVVLYLDAPLFRSLRKAVEGVVGFIRGARDDARDLVGVIKDRWVLFRERRAAAARRAAANGMRAEVRAEAGVTAAASSGTGAGRSKPGFFAGLIARLPKRQPKRDWAVDRPQLKRRVPRDGAKKDARELLRPAGGETTTETVEALAATTSAAPVRRETAAEVGQLAVRVETSLSPRTGEGGRETAPATLDVRAEVETSDGFSNRARVAFADTGESAGTETVEVDPVEVNASETSALELDSDEVIGGPAMSATEAEAEAVETDPPRSAGPASAVIQEEDEATEAGEEVPRYRLPPTALLERPRQRNGGREAGEDQAQLLEETLASFGIDAKVVQVNRGPVVTRYEVQPGPGVKVNRITGLADDIALALAAAGIRIEAPVPGKSVVGIEVPNRETSTVYLREVIESEEFQKASSRLMLALGKDIAGNPVVADLRKLLHVLIAGSTGSGKSVCINTIIASILYKALPHEVKLLLIDPKRVELAVYDGIPHLVSPVVTDPKQASAALKWAVKEMENRYTRFSEAGVRNIDGYNRYVEALLADAAEAGGDPARLPRPLPFIVIIIDELADLMMVAQGDVEDSICRLAQMARAAGIHLIIATQRPSVDVITGLIKANVPSRIAFAVASSHDSRTILDMVGAERLLGKGDMLFYPTGASKPWRAQGAFISDREVHDLVEFWKQQGEPQYREDVITQGTGAGPDEDVDDELFEDAVRLVVDTQNASISMLQRRFRIGYSRAARLIDMMEQRGIVGPYQGSKPREVLWTRNDLE